MEIRLENALKKDKLLEVFNKMPPSHQKAYITWIYSAKKEETIDKRISLTIKRLKDKNEY